MDMVCANVECVQEPATHITHLADGMIDALTLLGVKDNRLRFELALVAITPTITAWEEGDLYRLWKRSIDPRSSPCNHVP